ncbi:MAG TPA: hypothetical protein VIG86_11595 [Candidatus Dormibacteraeota bacterium]|jgi:hypothetical protein
MADAGSVGRPGAIAELLFVRGRNPVLRVVVAAGIAVACCVLGVYSLDIQAHFAAQPAGGRLSTFLAHGSTAATAWTGWAAAFFFGIALLRVRRGAPEPPGGRTPVEALTATQLRAGLVREYTVVRIGLTVLSAVTLTDVARAARFMVATASGDSVASTSVTATVVEALGLVAATVVLALWTMAFRRQLVRVGALSG